MNIRTLPEIVEECHQDSLDWFPNQSQDIAFLTLALAGEVGEFANIVKKVARGSMDERVAQELLVDEATDIFIYLCNLASVLKMDMEREYDRKRQFNVRRFGNSKSAAVQ